MSILSIIVKNCGIAVFFLKISETKMKKIIISLLVLLCAQAEGNFSEGNFSEGNFYAKMLGGGNFIQTKEHHGVKSSFQSGFIISGGIGWRGWKGFGLELEYSFRKNTLKKIHFWRRSYEMGGDFQSSSIMANVLWNLPVEWCFRPYIGIGCGYDYQQLHVRKLRIIHHLAKREDFSYQVIGGVAYPLTPRLDVALEYKFHKGGFKYIFDHSIEIGCYYNFFLCNCKLF